MTEKNLCVSVERGIFVFILLMVQIISLRRTGQDRSFLHFSFYDLLIVCAFLLLSVLLSERQVEAFLQAQERGMGNSNDSPIATFFTYSLFHTRPHRINNT